MRGWRNQRESICSCLGSLTCKPGSVSCISFLAIERHAAYTSSPYHCASPVGGAEANRGGNKGIGDRGGENESRASWEASNKTRALPSP